MLLREDVRAVKVYKRDHQAVAYELKDRYDNTVIMDKAPLHTTLKWNLMQVDNLYCKPRSIGVIGKIETVEYNAYDLPAGFQLWNTKTARKCTYTFRNISFKPCGSREDLWDFVQELKYRAAMLGGIIYIEKVLPGLVFLVDRHWASDKPSELQKIVWAESGDASYVNDLRIYFVGKTLYFNENSSWLFHRLTITGKIDFTNTSGEKVRTISNMFYGARFMNLDLSGAKLTNIRHMFQAFQTEYPGTVDLQGVNLSKVTLPHDRCICNSACTVTNGGSCIVQYQNADMDPLHDTLCETVLLDENRQVYAYARHQYSLSSGTRLLHRKEVMYMVRDGAMFNLDQKLNNVPGLPAPVELLPVKVTVRQENGRVMLGLEDYFSSAAGKAHDRKELDIEDFFSGIWALNFHTAVDPETVYYSQVNRYALPVYPDQSYSCIRIIKLGEDAFAYVLEDIKGDLTGYLACAASKFILDPQTEQAIRDKLGLTEIFINGQ